MNLTNGIKFSDRYLNNIDLSTIIENATCNKTEKYCFNGYYIENISNYLELNNDEKIIEKIPEYYIEAPIFSIIIPFVNNCKTLKRAIRSIQNQSFKFYEILLVNDKSSDNSSIIIEQLSLIDKRIKLLKNLQNYGAFFSRVIGMKFSKGEIIYNFDSDDMFATSNALENLYKASRISKVDTIEFNIICGKVKKYSSILDSVISKKDRNKILYGREIFNTRYLNLNNTIKRIGYATIYSKIFRKKVKNKILNYLGEIGLNNFKNWNYADDQFLTDLIKLFSDTYLHIDSIYYFYFYNRKSLCHKVNIRKMFDDHMKYLFHFNVLAKQYQLDDGFLIYNIMLFLKINFVVNKYDCMKIDNFIKEIRINRTNSTEYWKTGYKEFYDKYNASCNKFK